MGSGMGGGGCGRAESGSWGGAPLGVGPFAKAPRAAGAALSCRGGTIRLAASPDRSGAAAAGGAAGGWPRICESGMNEVGGSGVKACGSSTISASEGNELGNAAFGGDGNGGCTAAAAAGGGAAIGHWPSPMPPPGVGRG